MDERHNFFHLVKYYSILNSSQDKQLIMPKVTTKDEFLAPYIITTNIRLVSKY